MTKLQRKHYQRGFDFGFNIGWAAAKEAAHREMLELTICCVFRCRFGKMPIDLKKKFRSMPFQTLERLFKAVERVKSVDAFLKLLDDFKI